MRVDTNIKMEILEVQKFSDDLHGNFLTQTGIFTNTVESSSCSIAVTKHLSVQIKWSVNMIYDEYLA